MQQEQDLKDLIKAKGYRMDFVAEQIGINAATLRLIANGQRKTRRPVVKLLAQVLGVSEDQLVGLGLLQDEAS